VFTAIKCRPDAQLNSSAGLTIWQKRHMPRAPRIWGPRAYPLLFFFRIFCSLFQRGAKTVHQCGAPKTPSPPENARPQKWGPKRFLFPVSAQGPKSTRSPENVRPQNLKIEAPTCGAPNVVPCFSAGSKQRGAPK
jgi:hypothetical protein